MTVNCVSQKRTCCSHDSSVKLRSGASIVKIKPLFTFDSKFLLVASGCDIKVYSVASGECTLTFKQHCQPIVGLQTNKKNSLQVLSCSEDGVVMRWDYSDGKALKKYNLCMKSKISAFFAPDTSGPWFATTMIKDTDYYRLYSLTVKSAKASRMTMVMKPILPYENSVAFGPQGSFVAGIHGNSLLLYDMKEKISRRHKTGESNLTCVTCHPSEYILATGDSNGRIVTWVGMLDSNYPTRCIYHWHSLPVADLLFSSEGSHIYSGGGESVLVKWHVNSSTKQMLPRLGLPVCLLSASSDNSYIATAHIDNSLQIINCHNKVIQVIQGLTQAHCQKVRTGEILPTGMIYDPRTDAVVMNGRPGHLQFYNIHADKQLFQLDVVGQNYISQERESIIYNTDVEKAAIDSKGLWLATVECRDDGETSPEVRLKFWQFIQTSQQFSLNTNIFLPHNQKVNCLKFRPEVKNGNSSDENPPLAVTTSDDNRFKIWTLHDNSSKSFSWSCDLMGYYKDLPAGDTCFSEDGSLLAVSFSYVITLWTPDTNVLRATLCCSTVTDPVRQVLFGKGKSSHLLVCHTDEMLTVWNVLTLSQLWSVKCGIQCLASDPLSDVMASFSKDKTLYFFRPNDPKPIHTLKNVSESPVLSALFVPRVSQRESQRVCCWQQCTQLFFLNHDQVLLTVTDADDTLDQNGVESEKASFKKNLPATPFGLLQAEYVSSGVRPAKSDSHLLATAIKDENELLCPTNVNVISLCETVISSLLKAQQKSDESNVCATAEDTIHQQREIYFDPKDSSEEQAMEVSNGRKTEKFDCVLDDYSFLLEFVT